MTPLLVRKYYKELKIRSVKRGMCPTAKSTIKS